MQLSSSIARLSLCGLTLLPATRGLAWGDVGHLTVCEIATRVMSPKTRAALSDIIGDPEREFARQCVWPDQVKLTPEWLASGNYHFINYEDGAQWPAGDSAAFATGDVLQQIVRAKSALADPRVSQKSKLCHLRFLGHLAGDSHQPLHVGRSSDRGGNDQLDPWLGYEEYPIKVTTLDRSLLPPAGQTLTDVQSAELAKKRRACFEVLDLDPAQGSCVLNLTLDAKTLGGVGIKTSLHGLWDDSFIELKLEQLGIVPPDGNSYAAYKSFATFLQGNQDKLEFAASELEDSRSDDLLRWVEWSGFFRPFAYQIEAGKQMDIRPGNMKAAAEAAARAARAGDPDPLPYYSARINIVQKQILRAGYHLAGLLDGIFAGETPSTPAAAARTKFARLRNAELDERIAKRRGQVAFRSVCDTL